jgi:hypothetical protein
MTWRQSPAADGEAMASRRFGDTDSDMPGFPPTFKTADGLHRHQIEREKDRTHRSRKTLISP